MPRQDTAVIINAGLLVDAVCSSAANAAKS